MKKIVSLFIYTSIVLVFALSCGSSKDSTSQKKDVSLINTRWGLLSINGKKEDLSKLPKEVHITFRNENNRFDGFSGCNNISGTYEYRVDGTLKLSQMISTKMACLNDNDIESRFTKALESVTGYKIVKDELILLSNGKEVLRLYAVYLR
jgi:heat shock protein HslJ